jgi:hypothetical protein
MKKKIALLFLVMALLVIPTGCGNKTEEKSKDSDVTTNDNNEKEETKKKCLPAAKKAYEMYKSNHSYDVKDVVCSYSAVLDSYDVLFKAGDNIIFKYVYDVSKEKITSEDNMKYSTENMEENQKKCDSMSGDSSVTIVCTMQKAVLSEYNTAVKMLDSEYGTGNYARFNLSEIK